MMTTTWFRRFTVVSVFGLVGLAFLVFVLASVGARSTHRTRPILAAEPTPASAFAPGPSELPAP